MCMKGCVKGSTRVCTGVYERVCEPWPDGGSNYFGG